MSTPDNTSTEPVMGRGLYAADDGLSGPPTSPRQAAPSNKPGGSAPRGQQVAPVGHSSLGTPGLATGLSEGCEDTTGGGGLTAGSDAAPALYATVVVLENRLRNLAYYLEHAKRTEPVVLATVVREYADDPHAARTAA